MYSFLLRGPEGTGQNSDPSYPIKYCGSDSDRIRTAVTYGCNTISSSFSQ